MHIYLFVALTEHMYPSVHYCLHSGQKKKFSKQDCRNLIKSVVTPSSVLSPAPALGKAMGGRAVLGTLVSWLSIYSASKMALSSPVSFFGLASVNISTYFLLCLFAFIFSACTLWTTLMCQCLHISHTCCFPVVRASCGRGRRESWVTGLDGSSKWELFLLKTIPR